MCATEIESYETYLPSAVTLSPFAIHQMLAVGGFPLHSKVTFSQRVTATEEDTFKNSKLEVPAK